MRATDETHEAEKAAQVPDSYKVAAGRLRASGRQTMSPSGLRKHSRKKRLLGCRNVTPHPPRMSRHLRFATALLGGLIVASEASATLRACRAAAVSRPPPMAKGAEPALVPENPAGCRHGLSFSPEPGVTLRRCQVVPKEGEDDLPEGSPDYAFLIERPGRPMQVHRDELMAGRFSAFTVARVDLDGDGREERVLAAWNSQGNGLGVNSWTIRVFDSEWRLLHTFDDVSEWADTSIVAAPKGRRGCDLAITSFVASVNRHGVEGISFQARFFGLKDGKVAEAADRPAVERRYDFAFERERGRHFRRSEDTLQGDATTWLSHRSARRSPARP